MDQLNQRTSRFVRSGNLIWTGIALSAALWVFEAAVHAFVVGLGDFFQLLLFPSRAALLTRIVSGIIIVVFGVYAQWAVARRRAAEEALRESERRYRVLSEASTDAIFLEALDGRLIDCNATACALYGYTKEEFARLTVLDLVPEDEAARLVQRSGQQIVAGNVFLEALNRKKNGQVFPVEINTHLATAGDEQLVIVYVRDITERRQAQDRLRTRERFLECLADVTQELLQAVDLNETLPDILRRLGETAEVSRVYLSEVQPGARFSPSGSRRYEWCAPGITAQIDHSGSRGIPLAVEFARWSEMLSRGDVIAGPVAHLPDSEQTRLKAQDIHSILIIPIFVDTAWYGYIGFDACDRERAWQQVEIDLLRATAGNIASAIKRAHGQQQTQAMAEAVAALALTIDLEQVLDRILEQVSRVVPSDATNIMMIQDSQARIVRSRGYEQFASEELVSQLVFDVNDLLNLRQAADDRTTLVIPDTKTYPGWITVPGLEWLRSYAAAPIVIRDEVIGFLNVDSATPGFFTPAHAALLRAFADHAAVAIDNARLFEQARQRVAELEAVREASLSLTASLELSDVLESILASTMTLLRDVQHTRIFLYHNETLTFGAALWADGNTDRSLPFPRLDGLTYTVARQGAPLFIPDVSTHPLFVESNRQWHGAIIGLPLKIGRRVVGVMNVAYQQPRDFPDTELRVLRLLADQAAIAIENARLFQSELRQTRRLSLLADLARRVAAAQDADELLQTVAETIHAHFDYPTVTVFSLDDAANELVLRGFSGTPVGPTVQLEPGRYRQSINVGIVGHVASTKKPYIAKDVRADPYYYPTDRAVMRSSLCVPLLDGGRVIGAINVESDRPAGFDQEDCSLLEAVSDTTIIGLRNVLLLEEARLRAEELASALARLEKLDNLKDEFIQNVSHELRSPLALIRGYAEMLDLGNLGELQSEQRGPVSIIARRSAMLGELVEDITLILEAEVNPPQPEPVRLDELARAALEDFGISFARAELTCSAEIAHDLPPVRGSTIYVRRVLDNLLNNAVKFTPEGGHVTLRVWQDENGVSLQVSDTGIGIAPDQLEHIFSRFYQVDGSARRRYGGVGLGLALVKDIADTYGGRVKVESQLGQGAQFTVTFVAYDNDSRQER